MNETPGKFEFSTFRKFVSCRVSVAKHSIDLIVIIMIIYNINNNILIIINTPGLYLSMQLTYLPLNDAL